VISQKKRLSRAIAYIFTKKKMTLALMPQSEFMTRKQIAAIVGIHKDTPNGIVIIKRGDRAPLVCLTSSTSDKRYSDTAIVQNPNEVLYSFREQATKKDGTPYKHPKPFETHGPCFENKSIYQALQKYPELQVVLCMKHACNTWTICNDPFILRGASFNPVTKKGHFILYKPRATRGLFNRLQIREVEEDE
jgi:hypothetical protein